MSVNAGATNKNSANLQWDSKTTKVEKNKIIVLSILDPSSRQFMSFFYNIQWVWLHFWSSKLTSVENVQISKKEYTVLYVGLHGTFSSKAAQKKHVYPGRLTTENIWGLHNTDKQNKTYQSWISP